MALCLSAFPAAGLRTAGGVGKVYGGLGRDGYPLAFVQIAERYIYEVSLARGRTLVHDRGYTEYVWYKLLNSHGIQFLTRRREGGRYPVPTPQSIPVGPPMTSHQINRSACIEAGHRRDLLRARGCRDPQTGKNRLLVSSNLHLLAKAFGANYKSPGRSSWSSTGSSRSRRSRPPFTLRASPC